MFAGHFAVGLGGKALQPRVSLGTWFLSIQFLDLLWPVFLLLGWEHVRITPGYTKMNPLDFYDYPWTHSLVMACVWAGLFALGYRIFRRPEPGLRRGRAALLLGLGVLSHWGLDYLTHRPDLPLLPGMGRYVGLGLWDQPALAVTVEAALFVLGAFLYLRATRARDAAGRYGLAALLLFLVLAWLGGTFGPPPPNEGVLAWGGLVQWLFIPWAYWADRHREPVSRPTSS
ncbi:MAG TPA: hypothetical protein VHN15_09725 [Thermoanaerobaculia bacterium]|nr:hypothetical protein [Thermoanaerobaculia bacterium]